MPGVKFLGPSDEVQEAASAVQALCCARLHVFGFSARRGIRAVLGLAVSRLGLSDYLTAGAETRTRYSTAHKHG